MTAPKDPLSDEALRKAALEACYVCGEHGTVYDIDGNETPCPSCPTIEALARSIRDAALAEGRRLERERWIAVSHDRDYVTESAGASVRRAARLRPASPDAGEQGGDGG